ncbi:MAG: uracil-DNA glycosylase [Geobacteraceae bacterium]
MTDEQDLRDTLSSLRSYLEYLQETGVDELPLETPQLAGADSGHETLEMVREEIGECLRCQLGATRTRMVFGVGNPQARLVFVGEAPGRDEDLQGEPFVGDAGQLLTQIILAMGLQRSEVYICNVLKCRPPGNRNPHPDEIEECHPFLLRQLNAIRPAAVVALGTFATHILLGAKEPISKLRGQFHDYHGIPLMPTFHPAYLLRNPAMKKEVWQDMQQVMRLLGIELPQKK